MRTESLADVEAKLQLLPWLEDLPACGSLQMKSATAV